MDDTKRNFNSSDSSQGLESHATSLLDRCLVYIPAIPLLSGVILGFIICALLGRTAAISFNFSHFERFFDVIQPQSHFYATASELVSHARRKIPKDKTLVLVGGASYFRGTGQNPDELWTHELQNLLGDRYRVLNYAIDQAGATDFAGVAFQVLARENPRMVYVANMAPQGNGNDGVDGGDIYRYVFWDAYYKDMLKGDQLWQTHVKLRRKVQLKTAAGLELHLGKYIDSYTYSCDLWNYIGYRYFMTVWNDSTSGEIFRNRRSYIEGSDPNMAKHQSDARMDKEYTAIMEERNKGYTQNGTYLDKDGKVKPLLDSWNNTSRVISDLFSSDLHKQCLIVILHSNHYFMKSLTPLDWQRNAAMFKASQAAVEKAGYPVIQVGADFSADDYVDAGHFMASGGRKIAQQVAAKIKEMAH
jgi:hypothetical protein